MAITIFNREFFSDNYHQLLADSQWFQHLHPDPWYKVKTAIPTLNSWHTVKITVPHTVKTHTGNPHRDRQHTVSALLSAVNHCVAHHGEPGWHSAQWPLCDRYQWMVGLNMQSWLWKHHYLYSLWQCEHTATMIKLTHSWSQVISQCEMLATPCGPLCAKPLRASGF